MREKVLFWRISGFWIFSGMHSSIRRRVAVSLWIDHPYPQHQEVYEGVQRYAAERPDWELIIDEHPAYKRRAAAAVRYDGVIARAEKPLQQRLKRAKIPLVNVYYSERRPGVVGVYPDPQAMGRLAADHLIDRAFQRLFVLADRKRSYWWDVSRAIANRANEAGVTCETLEPPQQPYHPPSHWSKVVGFLDALLDRIERPAAVISESVPGARILIQQAIARSWRVPQDLAVMCMHDFGAILHMPPALTSAVPNYQRCGYEAAAVLDRLMKGESPPPEPIYIPPRGIMARQSTDYFAVEDEVVAAALHYISSRLREDLRVPDIAEAVLVSRRTLQTRFAEALGRSVTDEIRRLRLEAAKRMIAQRNRPIQEVAVECGFRNSRNLCQVFQRELGMSPRAFASDDVPSTKKIG